jgi:hypothetical protein
VSNLEGDGDLKAQSLAGEINPRCSGFQYQGLKGADFVVARPEKQAEDGSANELKFWVVLQLDALADEGLLVGGTVLQYKRDSKESCASRKRMMMVHACRAGMPVEVASISLCSVSHAIIVTSKLGY